MPSTRRDQRRSRRRRQPVEDAPSELHEVPPEASPESESPADPIPEPDPPIEAPVEDEEEDPIPEDPVEIPGPAEVPESVMEAMAGNLSGTTTKDSWPADHTPKKVGMLPLEDAEPVEAPEPEEVLTEEEISDVEAEAVAEESLEEEVLDDIEARADAATAEYYSMNAEVATEMDAGIDEDLDKLLNGAEIVVAEDSEPIEVVVVDTGQGFCPNCDERASAACENGFCATCCDNFTAEGLRSGCSLAWEVGFEKDIMIATSAVRDPINVVVTDTGHDAEPVVRKVTDQDDWDLHDHQCDGSLRCECDDSYVIRVPKGTVITLEKQE